ncbi:translation initiation factor IF-2 [Paenibacillus flagellatus]|uniref:Translation initiation factor IF-2 n=1 Tax=Paenibacillus flagellatus TaxID=2211139 RepID=A0A2V5JW63_9BACL|nr:translation initiation factor IF-2 [Paenibacillus flagellatus]PYI50412.1 translation initiation factor IF-2 [Paenibacillus flagellatus]
MTNQQDKDKDKLRVYEYAKSLNMSSKEIITILKRLNVPVNNHMSVMENDSVDKVEKFFRDVKANAAAKRAGDGGSTAAVSTAQGGRPQGDRPQGGGGQGNRQGGGDGGRRFDNNNRQGGYQGQGGGGRPQGDRPQGGGGQGNRQGGGDGQRRYDNNRPGGGYQGQGQGGGGRPQGDRPQGGGQGRPGGDGQRRYDNNRPGGGYQGQGQGGGGRPQGDRPQGGGQGRPGGDGQRRYDNNRPGGGYQGQGGGGRPQGDRPQGGGQGRPGGDGQRRFDNNRPGGGFQGQGGGRPQGAVTPPQVSRPPAPRTDRDRGFQDRERASAVKNTDPRFNKAEVIRTTVEDLDDINVAKTAKKPKPGTNNRSGGNNFRGGKGGRGRHQVQEVRKEKIDNTPKKIIVRGTMTVGELCKALHKDASEVIKKLLFLGVMATINQELDLDTIQLVATEFKVEVEIKLPVEEDNFETIEEKDDPADLLERPPVVTIMGHVDHGKTTLLDAIRQTNVTEGEAGGITQHIGAYQVEINGKKITFLDTPGHEAFTSMRARGAQVTDITIIVVAADDGVMPQTVEAINHAKAAGVPIIVAVNKIDKPDANPDKIKQELTEYNLVPEEWGGDTIFANISAKQKKGLEELLEMILLVAEVQEFKANPNKRARGTVIEAELDKGKGPVARILIQHGTLKIGDAFVAGVCFGRVRAMVNDKGRRLKEAGPSTPVEITGLTEVPQAGDPFMAFEDERKARAIAERRMTTHRQSTMGANTRVTLDDLYKHIKDGEIKDLNVIIKGDVQGSVEALKGSLEKIEVEGVRVKIIHNGVGAVTESDIILASASNAIIVAFNVRPEPAAMTTAEQEKVDIRMHSIIYKVIEEIEQAMKGMLDPVFKESVIGQAEVRNIFKVSKIGTIAGCMVTSGKITRSAELRLIRGGIVVFQGKVDSLKRFKDDVREVAQGYECGISIEKFNDIKEGDVIEAFVMETVER